jgi:hypothetical protein
VCFLSNYLGYEETHHYYKDFPLLVAIAPLFFLTRRSYWSRLALFGDRTGYIALFAFVTGNRKLHHEEKRLYNYACQKILLP